MRHDSDCALHNAPAYPRGLCDCSARARGGLIFWVAFLSAIGVWVLSVV